MGYPALCQDVLMAMEHILQLLISERDRLSRAIEALQGPAKRRGRPPKNAMVSSVATAAVPAPTPTKKGRRTFTAAQRKAQAEKMKTYWAKRKKEAAKK